MLVLLYVGGLRRTELASLGFSGYDPEERTVRIRGKGNKERRVYAEGGADLLPASWLELRGQGDPEEPLFLPVRKNGKVQHADPHGETKSSLSDQAVYKVVKRRHRKAKIKKVAPRFPQDLRRRPLHGAEARRALRPSDYGPLRQAWGAGHARGGEPPAHPHFGD